VLETSIREEIVCEIWPSTYQTCIHCG